MRRLILATAMFIAVSGCDRSEQRVAIHDPASKHTIYVTRDRLDQTIVDEGVTADEAAGILAKCSAKKQRIITNLEQDLADRVHQYGEARFEERVRLLQTECSLSKAEAVAQILDMPELLGLDPK